MLYDSYVAKEKYLTIIYHYFFVLGKNPALSIAEILSVLETERLNINIEAYSREIILLSTQKELDIEKFQRRLGGTIKIGKIISKLDLLKSESDIYKNLSNQNLFTHFFSKNTRKIHFGMSLYFLDKENIMVKNSKMILMNLSKYIKEEARKTNSKVGFVQIKDRALSSVSVVKNELLSKGAEIVLIIGKNDLFLGKTDSVQEFEEYSWRDYGRPQRDARRGLLPPKLAKMMINISRIPLSQTILDPFCGSGTILQEALLLGYKHIIGSDISKDAVMQSKRNIDWLKDKAKEKHENQKIDIFTSDVRNIKNFIPHSSIDAIVTEPYLGPPLKGFVDRRQAVEIHTNLKPLYKQAFSEFNHILKSEGRIVMVLPAFKIEKEIISIYMESEIQQMGFILKNLLPQNINHDWLEYTQKGTLVYGSPNHFLLREVMWVIKK